MKNKNKSKLTAIALVGAFAISAPALSSNWWEDENAWFTSGNEDANYEYFGEDRSGADDGYHCHPSMEVQEESCVNNAISQGQDPAQCPVVTVQLCH